MCCRRKKKAPSEAHKNTSPSPSDDTDQYATIRDSQIDGDEELPDEVDDRTRDDHDYIDIIDPSRRGASVKSEATSAKYAFINSAHFNDGEGGSKDWSDLYGPLRSGDTSRSKEQSPVVVNNVLYQKSQQQRSKSGNEVIVPGGTTEDPEIGVDSVVYNHSTREVAEGNVKRLPAVVVDNVLYQKSPQDPSSEENEARPGGTTED